MSTQLFYFSGTGNTLHVAIELQKRMPETNLMPIVGTLQNRGIRTAAPAVGLIFPLHFFTIPYPVELFLRQVDLRLADYIFAIVTRGGSPSGVFGDVNRLLRKKGKSLDAFFYIDMPGNCQCRHFEEATPNELIETEQKVQETLDLVRNVVVSRRDYKIADHKTVSLSKKLKLSMLKVYGLSYGRYALNKAFYADSKCTGCGLCAATCLAQRIDIKSNRPVWNRKKGCYFCFACINFCPVRAIQIKGFNTEALGRYHHALITPKEIQSQNSIHHLP